VTTSGYHIYRAAVERCTSSCRRHVRPSVCHTLVLCQKGPSHDHEIFTDALSVAWPGSEVRVGTGVWGRKSPSGVQGEALVEVWGQSTQKPDIYKQFAAVKCFSAQACCRVCPPLHLSPIPPTPKNSSDLRESHDPTRSDRVPVATLLRS